ncbi:hypothetical protein [Streptomyces sp. NPDC029674]|uniref:hypothetical protein n=1 Tax=Streptomyces sp. NPDC029674 TaxID=3365297 RepID=UPI00384AB52A
MNSPVPDKQCFRCGRPLPPYGETEECLASASHHGVNFLGQTFHVNDPKYRIFWFIGPDVGLLDPPPGRDVRWSGLLRRHDPDEVVPTSGEVVTAVVGTFLLTPFVTAVVATFGNRAGEALNRALRRFVQREVSGRGQLRSAPRLELICMRPERSEAQVIVDVDLPAHALRQIHTLDFAVLPAPPDGVGPPLVRWSGDCWIAAYALPERIHLQHWDTSTNTWKDGFSGPSRTEDTPPVPSGRRWWRPWRAR